MLRATQIDRTLFHTKEYSMGKEDRKDIFILRGLPGMGKSTIAELLASTKKENETSAICSADHYQVDEQGNYKFSYENLRYAHAKCQAKFAESIQAKVNVIVVDNTNTTHKEFKDYEKLGKEAGYRVFIVAVGSLDRQLSFERNSHDVPMDSINNMAKRWQP